MKIKISEATPIQLDWLVATYEGLNPRFFTEEEAYRAHVMTQTLKHGDYVVVLRPNGKATPLAKYAGYNDGVCWKDVFAPSTNWSQVGPIIEREKIAIDWDYDCWNASTDNHPAYYSAATPLIAAMRCYIASKLGDEVEIPEELQ